MPLLPTVLRRVEQAATSMISKCNISSPPINVEFVAKCLGLDVIPYDFGEDVSGALFIKQEKGFIGFNPNNHKKRRRFTIAHEIGHFVLHNKSDEKKIFVDVDFIVKDRSQTRYTLLNIIRNWKLMLLRPSC